MEHLSKYIIGGVVSFIFALVLRYLEDKSYEEISEILELPMGTVATLINRGRKRLRRNLEEFGVKP